MVEGFERLRTFRSVQRADRLDVNGMAAEAR